MVVRVLAAASMAAAAQSCAVDCCVLDSMSGISQGSATRLASRRRRQIELACRHSRVHKETKLISPRRRRRRETSQIEVATNVQHQIADASRPQAQRNDEPDDAPADGVDAPRPEDEHRVGADRHYDIDLVGVATERHDLFLRP